MGESLEYFSRAIPCVPSDDDMVSKTTRTGTGKGKACTETMEEENKVILPMIIPMVSSGRRRRVEEGLACRVEEDTNSMMLRLLEKQGAGAGANGERERKIDDGELGHLERIKIDQRGQEWSHYILHSLLLLLQERRTEKTCGHFRYSRKEGDNKLDHTIENPPRRRYSLLATTTASGSEKKRERELTLDSDQPFFLLPLSFSHGV